MKFERTIVWRKLVAKRTDLERLLKLNHVRNCGNCTMWMTRSCKREYPPEKRGVRALIVSNGMPSCQDFNIKQWSIDYTQKRIIEVDEQMVEIKLKSVD